MLHAANWKEIKEVVVRPGVMRKAFTGEGATLALNRLQPGHEPRPHAHPHEQIVYIIKGKTKFHVGDEMVVLEEGGLLVVPPNVVHYAEVLGDEEVINLDVFTPKREEYVK
ncbi:MAG TPA: cupin domain-containing protein [Firmicutes bacterium]|nr:cupin domain-containing protein [Bacillota bacterium]